MGFFEGLTLIFVALKLIGIISWSWWLVIFPMYPAILLYIGLFVFFGSVTISLTKGFKRK